MSTKKRLLTNFLSLASVQGLTYILPLITLPYLAIVLGPSKYGLVNFAQAFIQYFILFTDYGFNFVATKEVSLARDDKKKLSIIFSSVMFVRFMLLIISFLILVGLVCFIPKFQTNSIIYFLTFGMVLGNVLFPIWFFQGIEQMKVISILNAIAKIIFTIGIFVFVKEKSQFLYVPLFNTLGSIVIGIVALYIIYAHYKISFIKPSKSDIIHQLKEGWHIFVSNIVTSIYTTSNIFILGFFASDKVVGYYASAEKIVKAISSVISPLVQTVYPYLSKALQDSKERAMWILSLVFILITVSMGVLSLVIGFGAPFVVKILGHEYENSVPLIQILSGLPLLLGWANVFGILTMINFDYKKELSRIYIITSIFGVLLTIVLIPTFKQYGTAWNAILAEALATFLMAGFLWKKGIHVWKFKR
ncbi:flippase [Bacillus sp. 03113]|uniref:flippase n=1 Tax=Bacillus sp. 03113 TaxID=2578211 RepID=UPI001141FB07|nr:flippase [Bacillus sp. 03113]